MADVRWKDKDQLVALAGTELLAGTSMDGGAKVGGGTIPAGADTAVSTGLILSTALAQAEDAIADAIAALDPSGASVGVQVTADTSSTSDADPGAGNIRWNHATQASATVIYLDDASADGASLNAIWPRLNAGGVLFLQHATDQDTWQIWEFTAINDASGYAKLTVTLWGASGSFVDNDPILVTLDKGQAPSTAPTTQTITSASTVTPLVSDELIDITALAANLTVSDPSGTAAIGQGFLILLKSAAEQTLTWDSGYQGMDAALPTTTIAGKQMAIPVVRAQTLGKWLVFKPSVQP